MEKQLTDGLPEIFSLRRHQSLQEQQALTDQLYQQIGRLKVEPDWLKKNWGLTLEQKRLALEPGHKQISVVRQCELWGLARSSWYYSPGRDTRYNEQLMRMLDEQYIKTPCYGVG